MAGPNAREGRRERQKQRLLVGGKRRRRGKGPAGKGELNQGRESILSKAFATFSGANCVAAALKPGLPSINLFYQLPPYPAAPARILAAFYATF